jgi:hypothetical protein
MGTPIYPEWSATEKQVLARNINKIPYWAIAEKLPGRTVDALKQRAALMGLPRLTKFKNPVRNKRNEKYFRRPTIESAYWAGFIAADGCILTHPRTELRIGLHRRDRSVLELFCKHVEYEGKIAVLGKNCLGVTVCSAAEWLSDLKNIYNLGPRKTITLRPPNISGKLALAYSIGYIDGDGCWATIKGQPNSLLLVIVGTQAILEWMRRVFIVNGADVGGATVRKSKGCYRISISGSYARSVSKLLSSIPTPKLQRKWAVARGESRGQKDGGLE